MRRLTTLFHYFMIVDMIKNNGDASIMEVQTELNFHEESIQNLLKKFLLGNEYSSIEIEDVLKLVDVLELEKDSVVLREGQKNERLLLLLSGSVSVVKLGERLLSYTTPGTLLGEMSLITKNLCTATIIADVPVSILVLDLAKIAQLEPTIQNRIQNSIHQLFSLVLAQKLAVATEKVRLFEITNRELQRTQQLLATASAGRIEEISSEQINTLQKLDSLILKNERSLLGISQSIDSFVLELKQISDEARGIQKKFVMEKVLVCETDLNEQIQIKMALGAIGAVCSIVSNLEQANSLCESATYDILCLSEGFLTEIKTIIEKNSSAFSKVKIIYITSQPLIERIKILRAYPIISAIVVRDSRDKVFTMRNLSTTIRKLSSRDVFGLDKYLSWGTDVKERKVKGSVDRNDVIEEMHSYFGTVGVGRILSTRCRRIAEEMLMNAIYDAPTDLQGKSLYNHLSREVPIELAESDQAVFRFACDGAIVAISCEDRFGGLSLETILKYLERCLGGGVGENIENKGGGGNGLFQSIQSSSLYVFNVKPYERTEVIALFSTALQFEKLAPIPSFHYFKADDAIVRN